MPRGAEVRCERVPSRIARCRPGQAWLKKIFRDVAFLLCLCDQLGALLLGAEFRDIASTIDRRALIHLRLRTFTIVAQLVAAALIPMHLFAQGESSAAASDIREAVPGCPVPDRRAVSIDWYRRENGKRAMETA